MPTSYNIAKYRDVPTLVHIEAGGTMNDMERIIELNELRISNLDPSLSPEMRRYYQELNDFYCSNDCMDMTAEEATAALRDTPFYDGITIASLMDDVSLRERAMREVGYDDVADMHAVRRQKLIERGLPYAYSQEWIDDFNRIGAKVAEYNKRKEMFGAIFIAYFNAVGNPQSEHRRTAVEDIRKGVEKLQAEGLDFFELATQKPYRKLTMLTQEGMEHFVSYVRDVVVNGYGADEDLSQVQAEQDRIGRWARKHAQELVDVGKQETWKQADCVAIPSDDPCGYNFVVLKEVDY